MQYNTAETLKQSRIKAGLTVQEVSEKMIQSGYEKASTKTIYSWESGNSKPSPDYFLKLCDIYNISDILSCFGYKKSESPQNSELSVSIKLFENLTNENQKQVMDFMKFLASQQDMQ